MEKYTNEEITRMRQYEQLTGERVIFTFEERCNIYRTHITPTLRRTTFGIKNAINKRLSLDNNDSFDNPDDCWKLKVLEDNLEAIQKVLEEK